MEVAHLPETERIEGLISKLGPNRVPLIATSKRSGDRFVASVTNVSSEEISIPGRAEFRYQIRSSKGSSSGWLEANWVELDGKRTPMEGVLRLRPGQSVSFVFARQTAGDADEPAYLFTEGPDNLIFTVGLYGDPSERDTWIGAVTCVLKSKH